MKKSSLFYLLSLVVVFSMLLTACQPAATAPRRTYGSSCTTHPGPRRANRYHRGTGRTDRHDRRASRADRHNAAAASTLRACRRPLITAIMVVNSNPSKRLTSTR